MTLPRAFLEAPIAHRALHNATRPENSRAAIRAAIDHGYAIEIDIQPAACGTPMVFHDYQLARLTGASGVIRQHRADDLAQMHLLGSDEPIPTLAEALTLVAGRAPLVIEIKDQDGAMGPNLIGLEDAVIDALTGYTGDVALMSFNPFSVGRMAQLSSGRPIGLVTCAFDAGHWPHLTAARRAELAQLDMADFLDVDFISHRHTDLTSPRVQRLKTQGLPILCWTVRSLEDERTARQVADNITFEGYDA